MPNEIGLTLAPGCTARYPWMIRLPRNRKASDEKILAGNVPIYRTVL
jgi:hypothetical protein